MSIVYLNGEYLPIEKAKISVLDRGFLFADSVYEVVSIYNGKPFYLDRHLQRLQASLESIKLPLAMSQQDWFAVITNLCNKNKGADLALYIQVTRGAAPKRQFRAPDQCKPTVYANVTPISFPSKERYEAGFSAITTSDIRWHKPHIKTTALLANVMLYQEARARSADDAILIRDDLALEGPASNLFIVKDDIVITPPKQAFILNGITRGVQLELMREHNITCKEQDITLSTLMGADEIWLSSSTMEIRPIVKLNDTLINGGKPGPIWSTLFDLFEQAKRLH